MASRNQPDPSDVVDFIEYVVRLSNGFICSNEHKRYFEIPPNTSSSTDAPTVSDSHDCDMASIHNIRSYY